MLLAIDIGNTNIHMGLHTGDDWCCSWRARTIRNKMADEYAVLLRNFFEEHAFRFDDVEAVVMASVVPDLTDRFIALARRYLDHDPLNVDYTNVDIPINVDTPREVGPDRMVNAAAARAMFGAPAVVVDFGTSTNYDVLAPDGSYIGGAIAPGIGLAHDALVDRAARLYSVDLSPPPSPIGRNTIHAMQSGIFLGYLGLIEGLTTRIVDELDHPDTQVIATGGLAPLFAEHIPLIAHIAPNLTLEGLRVVWENGL